MCLLITLKEDIKNNLQNMFNADMKTRTFKNLKNIYNDKYQKIKSCFGVHKKSLLMNVSYKTNFLLRFSTI